jgi:hypothetical protein
MFLEKVTAEHFKNDFSKAIKVEKLLKEIKDYTCWLMPEVNVELGDNIIIIHSDKMLTTADKAIDLLQELKTVLSDQYKT